MLRKSRGEIYKIFILSIFIYGCNIVFAASLPIKPYVSTTNEEQLYADYSANNFGNEINPANGYYDVSYEIAPLLQGPPDLPPDPGTVPLGDWIPLLLFAVVYGLVKRKRFKINKIEI